MSDISARCTACGYEQPTEFPQCPVCGGMSSGWWCVPCHEWRPTRRCPACGGALDVPGVVELGAHPPGSRVRVRFSVRNPGKKSVGFSLAADDRAVAFPAVNRTLRGGETTEVVGELALGTIPPGRRTYAVRLEARVPTETTLVVEVVPAVVRLEFAPHELVFAGATPGKAASRSLVVRNIGNVPVAGKMVSTAAWVGLSHPRVDLAPGESLTIKVTAKTRKTEYGERGALLLTRASTGEAWDVPVRVGLPEPELQAVPIDLGLVRPGRPAYDTLILRNVGKVRVACELAADRPWLALTPKRVNLPPGREKVVKVRAVVPEDLAGPCESGVTVTFDGRQLLRVPVTALCQPPKPVLAAVRRQTLGEVANDAPAVRRFRVANTGDGRLDCTVTADQPWVEVLTPTLKVGPGRRRRVEFRLHAPNMPPGTGLATVRIRSNGGNADVPLSVVVVEPRPELEVLGDAELGTVSPDGSPVGYVSVRNVGVGHLDLTAVPEDPRVTVTPSAVRLPPGPPMRMAVTVAVAGLGGGEHAFGIRFAGNGGVGRAEVRFRLPAELLDLPSLIDLGDRPAGRPTSEALRVRNVGPDRVTLRIRTDAAWIRPGTDTIVVPPGQLVSVPFWVDLPEGVHGPVGSVIRIDGRAVRLSVPVRAVARRVELVATPTVLALGDMVPGEERAFTFQVENRGELPADVRESHTPGELEVWIRRRRVGPGETATAGGRVRMNTRGVGKKVRATVTVGDELSVRFTATVARPLGPRVVAGVAAVGGLAVGAVLGSTVGWVFGVAVAVAGILAAVVVLRNEAP